MKKYLFILVMTIVLAIVMTGCGKEVQSEPGEMELAPMVLTEHEAHLLNMTGIDFPGSGQNLGMMQYHTDGSVKSVNIKMREYSGKTGKWSGAEIVFSMEIGKRGDILIYCDNETRGFYAAVSDESGVGSMRDPDGLEIPEGGDFCTVGIRGTQSIVPDKEIPIFMAALSKQGTDPMLIGTGDYPDGTALKDYTKVWVVLIEFSDGNTDSN